MPIETGRWLAGFALGVVLPMSALAAPATLTDRAGITFVRIPAGSFQMGAQETPASWAAAFPTLPQERREALSDEGPVHEVRFTKDVWMGKTEITVGQFKRFVAATGHVPESVADGTGGYGFNPSYDPKTSPRGDAFEGRLPRWSWLNPGWSQTDDHPVVNVTWQDAVAMAAWLSQVEGVGYRLPTEAEWEYACKAGTTTRFSTGDEPASLQGHANLFDQGSAVHWPHWQQHALPWQDGFAFTAPVAQFKANAWGLHDMHGNVWEWTADWYGENTYAQSPRIDPTGPADGGTKVRRGGSWHTWPAYARCSFRNWNTPQTRYTLVGFRLVRDVQADGR